MHDRVVTCMHAGALSGGTRRKVSLALALTGSPQLILLDEPSAGEPRTHTFSRTEV